VLDKIKKELDTITYGSIVLNISPDSVIVEVTKRSRINDDCPIETGKKGPNRTAAATGITA
jgi:hypothetical protein